MCRTSSAGQPSLRLRSLDVFGQPSTLILRFLTVAVCALFVGIPCASAAVLVYSDGSDISGYVGSTNTNNGGSVVSAEPFVIDGVSQGSYFSATSYPRTNFDTTIDASAAGNQEIWVSFLMRRDSSNSWAGGIVLFAESLPAFSDEAAVIGWNTQRVTIALYDGSETGPSTGFPLSAGQSVAVLARIYENAASGLFDRGDLYIDGDLTDGIDFGTAIVFGDPINTGANSIIGGLRLGADPANGGETRFYDNIAVTTTQAEAVSLVQGVPEPSTPILVSFAAMVLGALRRRRRRDH